MIFDSYDAFREAVLSNLSRFNQYGRGYYPRTKKYYDHIAALSENATLQEKLALVQQILADDGVNPDMFSKPHKDAHHLNSSQVVCYEFFRPMLTTQKRLNDKMFVFLDYIGIPSDPFKDGFGEFEWEPDPAEQTNFDFYIQQSKPTPSKMLSDNAVFFEIKYTENEFGAETINGKRRDKYGSIYQQMIENCACLRLIPSIDEFFKSYQLFRNTLRLTKKNWRNEYVIFLFPKANKAVMNDYLAFMDRFVMDQYHDHIKAVFWEDLTDAMSDNFRNKYFSYVADAY